MKKTQLLLLFVLTITLMACPQKDDDMPPEPLEPVYGTWKYFKSFENGEEVTLELCETEETLTFSPNGNYSGSNYEEVNGVCELEETITGTWAKSSTDTYDITIEGETESEELVFEDYTFYFEYSETEGSTTTTYKEVYKRL